MRSRSLDGLPSAKRGASLRIQLIYPFVILIVVAVISTGFLSLYNGGKAAEYMAWQLMDEIEARIEDRVLRFLNRAHLVNELNANAIESGQIDLNNMREQELHFWRQVRSFDYISYSYIGRADGGFIGARRLADGTLQTIATETLTGGKIRYFNTDNQGLPTTISSSLPYYDHKTRPWYKAGIEADKPTWSPVFIDAGGEGLTITAATPLYDNAKTIKAVLGCSFIFSHINQFLRTLKIGESGLTFIIERSGMLVATSTLDATYTGDKKRIASFESENPRISQTGKFISEQFGNLSKIDQKQRLSIHVQGERNFVQLSPLTDHRGIDWLIVVIIPENDFMSHIKAGNLNTALLSLVALGVTIMVGFTIARRITRPIMELNTAAWSLAEGDWSRELRIDRRDEVGELARSFNHMVKNLQTTTVSRDRLVEEIEERKKVESELLKLAAVVEHSSELVILAAVDGKMIFLNEAGGRMLGIPPRDVGNYDIMELVPDELKSRAENELLPTLLKEGRWEGDFQYRNLLTDTLIDVHAMTFTIRSSDDELLYLANVSLDITERKRAEKLLRESEQKLSSILNAAPIGIGVVRDRIIIETNDLLCTMTGYSREELLHKSARILYPTKEEYEWVGREKYRQISEKGTGTVETKWQRKDGAVIEVLLSSTPLHHDILSAGVTFTALDITQRKLAEAAAQTEKEKYSLLVKQVPGIVFKGYADYSLDCFDDKIETLTGYTQGEFNSRAIKWNDVELEEYIAPVREQLKKALKSDGFYVSEFRIRKKSGELVWVQARNQVVKNAQGRMDYISGVFFDINEHKLAADAIARERILSDHIINSLPGIFYMFDDQGNLVRWNRKYEEVTGYSPEELLGMHVLDFFSEAHKDYIALQVQTVFAEGEAFAEAPFLTKGGEQIPYFFTGRLTVLDGKQYLLGVGVDITERKRFEEALEKRLVVLTRPLDDAEGITFEELFNLDDLQRLQDEFARATRVASIITHPDGTPITAPSNFCRLCSDIIRKTEKGRINCYRSDAVIGLPSAKGPTIQPCMSGGLWDAGAGISIGGRHIANWLIGQVRDETQTEEKMRAYAREIGADEAATIEAFLEVPTMSLEQFGQVAQALFTLANQLSATAYQNVQQARFITERKRAEEEKDALQARLVQAQKMESVGRLAGGVAHDFNNMLSAILGNAELAMMRCSPSDPIHGKLKVIEESALRSADLVRQLLAFARRQTVAPKVLDLNESVTGMLKMLLRLIGEDIDLVWAPRAGLWAVKIDPSQVDQLLANLCVNARDAITGVGKVTMETENVSFDEAYCAANQGFIRGEYVMLAVSDDGCGINKDVMDQLFEPFFTTKEAGKGTGLGLATVYGIVKQNEGFINVYSEPGKGSTFKIYLPRFAGEAVEPMDARAEDIPKGRGETVLLVEDEAVILSTGRTMLEELGYTVLTANTPGEALRQAAAHAGEIQLLITDVVMPEMNGRDLAKLLSDIKPGLKRLFVSGYTANVIAHRGVLDEGVHFLQKPFSTKDLAVKVRECLDKD